MNRKFLILATVLLLITAGLILKKSKSNQSKDHYHAGFQVYVNNKLQNFSGLKYMHLKPCGEEDEHKEDEQLEKAHLHNQVGDIVHVHRGNAYWKDLFKNIKFKIDSSKPIEGYVNGIKVENILNHQIKANDSVLIIIGKKVDLKTYLKQAVKKEYIKKVEKEGESC